MDKRNELAQRIKELVETQNAIRLDELNPQKYGRNTDNKNGIYYIYNKTDEIIYAGKVGDSKSTSLYDRMIGHGNGSHSKQDWWDSAKYIKFKIFDMVNESQLLQLERLSIIAAGNPINNDKIISENDVDVLDGLLPPH